jgi:Right handed beta helix region/Bacterial Ig domain
MEPRRPVWVISALGLCGAALLLSAFDTERDRPLGATSRIGAPVAIRPAPPARVAYTGPRQLEGVVTLRARVGRASARIVAVTFRLDGEPLGTDTRAPWRLDVDTSLLPEGRHRIRVVAVDALGARTAGRAVSVRVVAGRRPRTVTPATGLGPVLPALARGGVSVRLAPGSYPVRQLELGDGARLTGSGPRTVLTAAAPGWSLVTVRGRRVRLSGLTIDGAGRADRAVGVAAGSHDVRLQRLRIGGIRVTGVEVWGAHSRVSVQDSVIAGSGAAGSGVFELGSDESRDMSVIRTRIAGFRSYGINFAQRAYDRPAAALHALALDNDIGAIDDPGAADGTHEGGIWSGGVAAAIIGNHVRDTGWDGIQTVGSSRRVTVVDNRIARTRVGIYLEHETNDSLFARNDIADARIGINVEWRYDDAGSSGNTFEANTVVRPAEAGVFVDVEGDRNRIVKNVVAGGSGPAVVLQGASGNLVAGNRGCARPGQEVVVQQSARHDDGRAAHSLRNRLRDNTSVPACPGR